MGKNILVAYFSCSGVTRRVAETLAEAANAGLYEIKPAIPYTRADLDWTNKNSRSTLEMNNPAARPEIADVVPNMAEYDIVFVGFPIWWYTAPSIVRTFFESYDFSGKTIVPFATSGSSGLGRTEEDLRAACPNDARWLPGKLLNGASKAALSAWIKELKL